MRSSTFVRVDALHASCTILSTETEYISVVVPINEGVWEYSSCLDSARGQPTIWHKARRHP